MDFTKQYIISNLSIINKLLPYYVRGKNMVSFLSAVTSPLIKIHNEWLPKAQELLVIAKVPCQVYSMEKYLSNTLSQYFENPDNEIKIDLFASKNKGIYISSINDTDTIQEACKTYSFSTTETIAEATYIHSKQEISADPNNRFNILAPVNNDNIGVEEYKKKISNLLDRYICTTHYDIIINQ